MGSGPCDLTPNLSTPRELSFSAAETGSNRSLQLELVEPESDLLQRLRRTVERVEDLRVQRFHVEQHAGVALAAAQPHCPARPAHRHADQHCRAQPAERKVAPRLFHRSIAFN